MGNENCRSSFSTLLQPSDADPSARIEMLINLEKNSLEAKLAALKKEEVTDSVQSQISQIKKLIDTMDYFASNGGFVEAKTRHQEEMQEVQRLLSESKLKEEQLQTSLRSSLLTNVQNEKDYQRKAEDKIQSLNLQIQNMKEVHSKEKYDYDLQIQSQQEEYFQQKQQLEQKLLEQAEKEILKAKQRREEVEQMRIKHSQESKLKEDQLNATLSKYAINSQNQSYLFQEMKQQETKANEEIQNLKQQCEMQSQLYQKECSKQNQTRAREKEQEEEKMQEVQLKLLKSIQNEEQLKASLSSFTQKYQSQSKLIEELKEQHREAKETIQNLNLQIQDKQKIKEELSKEKQSFDQYVQFQKLQSAKEREQLEETFLLYQQRTESMIEQNKREASQFLNQSLVQLEQRLTSESNKKLAAKQEEWNQQKQALESQICKMSQAQSDFGKQKVKEILKTVELSQAKTDQDFEKQLKQLNPQQDVINQCQIEFVKQFQAIENENPTIEQVKVIETKHLEVQQKLVNQLQKYQGKPQGSVPQQEMIKTDGYRGILLMHAMLAEQGITTYITDKPMQQLELSSKSVYQQKIIQCGIQDSSSYFTANYDSPQVMENQIQNADTLQKYIENFKNDMVKKLGDKDVTPQNITVFAVTQSPPSVKYQINSQQKKDIKSKDFKSLGINVQTQNLLDKAELSIDMFEPQYNMSWDNMSSKTDQRGALKFYKNSGYTPQVYKFPIGYYGLGLRVLSRYGSDQKWIRADTLPDTWIVLFHGTGHKNLKGIINPNKINPGINNAYGGQKCRITGTIIKAGPNVNTYLADDVLEAEPYSINLNNVDNVPYSLVFQCRVNPNKVKSPEAYPAYYTIENPLDDIRPYRLLIKQTRN